MSHRRTLLVYAVTPHETVAFAASELRRYLAAILKEDEVEVVLADEAPRPAVGALRLGLFTDLDNADRPAGGWPEVPEPEWDDAVAVYAGRGFVGGANPRSVLLGVYRLLRELGCAWVRPGPLGERIPSRCLDDLAASLVELPSYRHRAICIEGAVSYANVAELIDWAPKAGFNGYFFQFRESFIFFERWYSHRNNPLLAPEPFDVDRARAFVGALQGEISRRGLIHHAVGHGWTCEPLGIAGLGWDRGEYAVAPEVRELLAEVNGRREIWRGVPLNTNLCYSNPAARAMVAEGIAEYLATNPTVDLLHFWLADGSNNQCECAACRRMRPSDYYVRMLNELDEVLTERGIRTRIVFLIYVDLLWPPERERLRNPERFVLMFAPITRSYREPFRAEAAASELPPYRRNALTFPSNPGENLAFLRAWQDAFRGDSFAFEYHLWRAHFSDPGQVAISTVLAQDVRALRDLGLHGYVSCQVQRAFFPTALPMHVLGAVLWDRDADVDGIFRGRFEDAFGPDGDDALRYLRAVSATYARLGDLGSALPADAESTLGALERTVTGFRPAIERHLADPDPCVARSWWHLHRHADVLLRLIRVLRARATGDARSAERELERLEEMIRRAEQELQPVLDVWAYLESLHRVLAS